MNHSTEVINTSTRQPTGEMLNTILIVPTLWSRTTWITLTWLQVSLSRQFVVHTPSKMYTYGRSLIKIYMPNCGSLIYLYTHRAKCRTLIHPYVADFSTLIHIHALLVVDPSFNHICLILDPSYIHIVSQFEREVHSTHLQLHSTIRQEIPSSWVCKYEHIHNEGYSTNHIQLNIQLAGLLLAAYTVCSHDIILIKAWRWQ